jgi:endonuclease/exonuclease/phosphatase (EEP) superfamily protein YafD
VLRRRLAVASLIALWCALLAAMLGRYAWPFDLFAHFRVQYSLLFLILAILLFALRAPLLAVVAIAGGVVGAIPIVNYMGVTTARAEAGSAKFRVVAFNTWFRNHDYAAIGRFLERTQADVIVIEERDRDDGAKRIGDFLQSHPHSFNAGLHHGAIVFSRWPIVSAESLALAENPGVRAATRNPDSQG